MQDESIKLSPDTKSKLLLLYPGLQTKFYNVVKDLYHWSSGTLILKLTEGLRSFERQEKLFAQGRTEPGKIVTFAKPGYSLHQYGLAWDAAFEGPDPYLALRKDAEKVWLKYGASCKEQGMRWGGDFKELQDKPHADQSYGLSVEELNRLCTQGGLSTVYQKLNEVTRCLGAKSS